MFLLLQDFQVQFHVSFWVCNQFVETTRITFLGNSGTPHCFWPLKNSTCIPTKILQNMMLSIACSFCIASDSRSFHASF